MISAGLGVATGVQPGQNFLGVFRIQIAFDWKTGKAADHKMINSRRLWESARQNHAILQ
jgi:hypothetical protein